MKPAIAITTGEPAGVGPEISLRAAWALRDSVRPLLIGDFSLLAELAPQIDPDIRLKYVASPHLQHGGVPDAIDGFLPVLDCPLVVPVVAGQPDARNAQTVLNILDAAVEGARGGWFDAIATAPLQKSTINESGVAFSGHTEYFAEKTSTPDVVMMLVDAAEKVGGRPLRVALATTHLPLKEVAQSITYAGLSRVISLLDEDLKARFNIAKPKIFVTGLNPHAGEEGYLGDEEINIITPVIDAAQKKGILAEGPFPADTLFQPRFLDECDAVLAMYHDQGLPVLKHVSFGRGVNVTLGMPIIRTSVDHGTALDLAEKGVGFAHGGSMEAAIKLASQIALSSKK